MILFTLERNNKIRIIRYGCITLFCLVVFLVYNIFSHGVYSNYMTFLFAWPLMLGLVPSTLIAFIPALQEPSHLTKAIYHAGLASVTVSSLLRGIFDIAGTASSYQMPLMYFGIALLVAGSISYMVSLRIRN